MIEKQKQAISEYLRQSEKNSLLIGAELEFLIVDKFTKESISYYGKHGIEELLKTLTNNGFTADLEDDHIIGVHNEYLAITLEPGAQWEISLNPQKSFEIMEANYLEFMELLLPILQSKNQIPFSSGYLPISRIDDIKFIPKKRYKYMSEYLGKTGKYAHNMMKGTASIQVAIDFRDEEDFIRKMRLACRLTPIFSAVFDNTAIFEGKPYKDFCLRTLIWNCCDNQRCGIVPSVFYDDFGYQKYAEYILNLVPIIIQNENGSITSDDPFFINFDLTKNIYEQLNHIFSMCFPDVRARNYIELRMTDSLPYPLNFAFVELIDFIFNDDDNFEMVEDLLEKINLDEINMAKQKIIKKGINAEYNGKTIIHHMQQIMKNIPDGKYQTMIKQMASKEIIPRELEQIGGQLASTDI
ncbi:MAG: glutamate--cysteine ligase [Candidatus Cloacimonetes bacterium]|nr:glutamate--cysteine ligase [Candidatus Cloacimonadota bacterium]MCF7867348.1 glutamate--cysteine ligase [Candidatus Cloacimonadota bacterium]MCF7882782.1 glutamate--cysteine ligase [Candidatus Cloacimonadota bacterium]